MTIRFSKYEGAGNDFILLDLRAGGTAPSPATIARLCDRHFGVGADGVLTLSAPTAAGCDCSMRYYNADGSSGEMCGNGGRCFALFAHHLGIGGDRKRFDSIDGIHEALIRRSGPFCGEVELGMIDVERIERSGEGWFLNTGVPHYVEQTDDLEGTDVPGRGRRLRYDARFPEGANVNFVQVAAADEIAVRTYERGVEAETLACGTGSVASALAVHAALRPEVRRFSVLTRGGRLEVSFDEPRPGRYTNIRLSGPARKVFDGAYDPENFPCGK